MKSFLFVVIVCVTATASLGNVVKVNTPHASYYKDLEKFNSRVVNGQNAERNQFPYQVSVRWGILGSRSHVCGGSIISESYVLTAAHCIQSYGSFLVDAGLLNRAESTTFTQSRNVAGVTTHPNWPGGMVVAANDIAIMRTRTPFVWTEAVQPVGLPAAAATFSGTAYLSGWGRTSSTSNLAVTLQFARKLLITTNECANILSNILGTSAPFDNTMVCTSGSNGVSACSGDSGGPLVQNGVLVGIVSWGISPCGFPDAPSVYTRTASFIPWILSNS